MKGSLSGRPTECRYCRYLHLRDVVMATILAFYIWGAHWCHLANTTEPPMRGGDAGGLMSNYFDHLFLFLLYFITSG